MAPSFAGVDFYAVLRLSQEATAVDISTAYRKLARELHPDRNRDDPDGATAAFQKVQEAHEVLGVEERRQLYDAARAEWLEANLSLDERLARQRARRARDEAAAESAAEAERQASRAKQIAALDAVRADERDKTAARLQAQMDARKAEKAAADDAAEQLRRKRQRRREKRAQAAGGDADGAAGTLPTEETGVSRESDQ